MTKDEKGAMIEELVEKFKASPYFYITNANGMSVAETNNLRRKCFQAGIEYRVFKNTLIAKALEQLDTDYSAFENEGVLKGASGIMFHAESGKAAARLIKDFAREAGKNNKLTLKGAAVDQAVFIGNDQLETLLNLKSREELIGEIIGLLQSPAKNVLSGLQSGGGKLAGILKTLSERPE